MGDRCLIQIVKKGEKGEITEFSPACYLHWCGNMAEEYIRQLADLMSGRDGDVSYAFARLVGICHIHIDGNMSLGVWNAEEPLQARDTHGDAGVYLVDCNSWDVEVFGGYGKSFQARPVEVAA